TSCGTSKTRSARPAAVSTKAQAVLVVPRSMPTMKRAAIDELGDLHLGRCDEVRVSGAARGEARARHAPARVTQHAAEGRLAADVARPPARAGARPPAPARTAHPGARRARRPRRRNCPRRPRPRARARGGDAGRACPPCYHTAVARQACEGGLHRGRTQERNRFMPPLERYARFLTGHAWTVLVAVGVATAVLAAGMGRLRVSIDFEASLPANHPFVQIDHQIRREFGGRNTMIVAIVPRDGEVWRSEVLRVVQDVTFAALRLPDVI